MRCVCRTTVVVVWSGARLWLFCGDEVALSSQIGIGGQWRKWDMCVQD